MLFLIIVGLYAVVIITTNVHSYLTKPQEKKNKNPLLIHIPGVGGVKEMWLNAELARLAKEKDRKSDYFSSGVIDEKPRLYEGRKKR